LATFDDPAGLVVAPAPGGGRRLIICDVGSHTIRALSLPPLDTHTVDVAESGTDELSEAKKKTHALELKVEADALLTEAEVFTSFEKRYINAAQYARAADAYGEAAGLDPENAELVRLHAQSKLLAAQAALPKVVTIAGCSGQSGDRDGPAPEPDVTRHNVGHWMRGVQRTRDEAAAEVERRKRKKAQARDKSLVHATKTDRATKKQVEPEHAALQPAGLLCRPSAAEVDEEGNIYLACMGDGVGHGHTIRLLTFGDSSQLITVAGQPGVSGHCDGAFSQALFCEPVCLVLTELATLSEFS
jgi:hypothetical protein